MVFFQRIMSHYAGILAIAETQQHHLDTWNDGLACKASASDSQPTTTSGKIWKKNTPEQDVLGPVSPHQVYQSGCMVTWDCTIYTLQFTAIYEDHSLKSKAHQVPSYYIDSNFGDFVNIASSLSSHHRPVFLHFHANHIPLHQLVTRICHVGCMELLKNTRSQKSQHLMSPMIFRKFHFRYLKPFGKWLTFHGSVQSFYYTTPLSDLDGVTKALYKTNMLQAFANCVTLEPFCAYVRCTGSTWVEKMCGTSFKSECVGKG